MEGGSKKEDEEWLARFPMTRAVSKAMDVVQEVGYNNILIDSFFGGNYSIIPNMYEIIFNQLTATNIYEAE